ncbi:Uncharacterized protein BM_BM13137 [Brugia malayi]|uniref:Bm13137 n=1 Tax=Brugia malayi TaxID=6279 RepID=A0A0J9XYZ3_BRUMA|nr:Uncharacterized protein BM_BM13137 [Brugia malayi]CDP98056.1 Bm13137 [Brugia malayi]VIO93825.1 Uncharacterized protein BM_BM13137 [Brugia malayi]
MALARASRAALASLARNVKSTTRDVAVKLEIKLEGERLKIS